MKKITLFALVVFTVGMLGCNNANQEIKTVVESFYKNYTADHNSAKTSLLSANLSKLLSGTIKKEKASEEAILKSTHPNDKPDLIEGDIFSSLYEGPTSVSVEKIKIDGDTASVTANFKNATYKTSWQDEILLIKEKSWKIDNIIYKGESPIGSDAKKVLKDFIKGE